jgi:exodeoxyribonuclease-3
MKILSWNVAGIRAVLKKNALDFVCETVHDYDVLCFQETKAEQIQVNAEKFKKLYPYQYWNHSKKRKGYSGTSIWSKVPFERTFDHPVFDDEGRIVAVEFKEFILVTVYTPNSKGDLSRLTDRTTQWDPLFRDYCNDLKTHKPVVICGDLNVIHQDIDIYQPENHQGNIYAGYTVEERSSFQALLDSGYEDAFRLFNNKPGQYTWWSYLHNARSKNIGWRLDYFLIDSRIVQCCNNSSILNKVLGSDHCPITLFLDLDKIHVETTPIDINPCHKRSLRRRSRSYPTPPDELDFRYIQNIKKPQIR